MKTKQGRFGPCTNFVNSLNAYFDTQDFVSFRDVNTYIFFFFNETAPPEISPLSPHAALPLSPGGRARARGGPSTAPPAAGGPRGRGPPRRGPPCSPPPRPRARGASPRGARAAPPLRPRP